MSSTVGLASTTVPAVAAAEGTSIAGATPAVFGQQEFGNTANGGVGEPGCDGSSGQSSYRSWWALSVTAGDALTIDWETHTTSMDMNLWPVGTTDFTFLTSNPLVSQQVNANFKEQATYTAVQTGILPLEFHSDTGCNNPPAPYNFTATVLHAVVLSVPTVHSLPTSGTITVGVHNPDGVPISDPSLSVSFDVLASGSSSYGAVGSAPVVNGAATIAYAIPAGDDGKSVTVEATSSGVAYLPDTSSTQVATVAKPPPPPPQCVVPPVRRNEALAQMESAIRRAHCAVGSVHHVATRHHRGGVVISLSPRSGSHVPSQTHVQISVARRG